MAGAAPPGGAESRAEARRVKKQNVALELHRTLLAVATCPLAPGAGRAGAPSGRGETGGGGARGARRGSSSRASPEPGRPDAVVDREDLLRVAPQLVLPNRSPFTLDEVLESVVETVQQVSIETTPGEDVGTYDSFLRKSVT